MLKYAVELLPTVAISEKEIPSRERSIRKESSLLLESCQFKEILLFDIVFAVSDVGANGRVRRGVALTSAELELSPHELKPEIT